MSPPTPTFSSRTRRRKTSGGRPQSLRCCWLFWLLTCGTFFGTVIRVHDTLLRKKVDLDPLEPGKVRMYVCGPTTYNFIHLGNARPLVAFDVVARHLRARGFQVTYVRNITDVDDKIIRRAAELGEDPSVLTRRFTDEFHADAAALACVTPDLEPRVT